jgi:hypothetical protein
MLKAVDAFADITASLTPVAWYGVKWLQPDVRTAKKLGTLLECATLRDRLPAPPMHQPIGNFCGESLRSGEALRLLRDTAYADAEKRVALQNIERPGDRGVNPKGLLTQD